MFLLIFIYRNKSPINAIKTGYSSVLSSNVAQAYETFIFNDWLTLPCFSVRK